MPGIGIGIGLNLKHAGGRPGTSIALTAATIAENAANGTEIGDLSVVNPPPGAGVYTFTIESDPDNVFGVTGDALDKDGTLDYETATSHQVQIKATDGTFTHYQWFTITVTNVAPVLSNATDTKTGQTTATLTVDTTEDTGTLYWVVTESATPPTAAQVKLGKDNSGVAAAASGTQAISTVGTKTVMVTGLTAATAYTAHFMHEENGSSQSNVASGNGFTTDSTSVTQTWNPSDKVAAITLSNGDLDAANSSSGSWSPVRGTDPKSAGKLYYEIVRTDAQTIGATAQGGIASTAHTLASGNYLGSFTASFGVHAEGLNADGITIVGSATPVWTVNKVLGFAVDLDAGKIWVAENNAYLDSGNPAAGTNPFATFTAPLTLVPAAAIICENPPDPDVLRLHANTSNMTYSPPTGFSPWSGA